MFGWAKRWWRARQESKRLRGRELFGYHDGRTMHYADPFRLWRDLTSHATVNFPDLLPFVQAGHEPETTQVMEAVATAFGVARWTDADRSGMTDWELLDLLGRFTDYVETVKKNSSLGQTLPSSTGSASSDSSVPPTPDMSASSASTSTPSEATSAAPIVT